MNSVNVKTIKKIPNKLLTTTGVKPAVNTFHSRLRILLFIGIIILILWSIYNDDDEDVQLTDIEDIVKPGTIMYASIQEMEPEVQKKYLASLKHAINDKPESVKKRYLNGLKMALIAGTVSEYIVNGNSSKPVGIIAKTVLYSILLTTYR